MGGLNYSIFVYRLRVPGNPGKGNINIFNNWLWLFPRQSEIFSRRDLHAGDLGRKCSPGYAS